MDGNDPRNWTLLTHTLLSQSIMYKMILTIFFIIFITCHCVHYGILAIAILSIRPSVFYVCKLH